MVDAAIGGVTRRSGLSRAAFNALAVIEGEGAPMLTGEVAARMHITSGSITSVLDTLERKGLVVRSNDPGDRRRVLVDITPEAQALLDDLLPRVQQTAGAITTALTDDQLVTLLSLLGELRSALGDVPADLPEPEARRRPGHLTRRA